MACINNNTDKQDIQGLFKPTKHKDFIEVPKRLFNLEGLSGNDILVYCLLLDRYESSVDPQITFKYEELERITGLTRPTVAAVLKKLNHLGLISKQKKGFQGIVKYIVF